MTNKAKRKRDHAAEWKRRRPRFEAMRAELESLLGAECSKRGCKETTGLEYNHKKGRSWEPSRVNMVTRLRLYLMDARSGRLSRLCKPHNIEDARARKTELEEKKIPNSVVGETVRAVRELPKAMRPGPVRRRMVARIVKKQMARANKRRQRVRGRK